MTDFDLDRDFEGEGRGRRGRFARFARAKAQAEPEQPIDYKNTDFLSRYVTAQGKIVSRKRSGFSGQNQRKLAAAIKHARFLALLPFVGRS
ncbi:MAG TPA: 30S ribosomal protein S18 [Planctomycetota bacterium]|nr:30S ribosomal protein S18 [Planctomycetota bacterium]